MSKLFRESAAKPYRKGVVGVVFYFFVWIISYSFGYFFGMSMRLLGVDVSSMLVDDGEIMDGEVEEMIKTMNEEGPNN